MRNIIFIFMAAFIMLNGCSQQAVAMDKVIDSFGKIFDLTEKDVKSIKGMYVYGTKKQKPNKLLDKRLNGVFTYIFEQTDYSNKKRNYARSLIFNGSDCVIRVIDTDVDKTTSTLSPNRKIEPSIELWEVRNVTDKGGEVRYSLDYVDERWDSFHVTNWVEYEFDSNGNFVLHKDTYIKK
jgi:hypothetical protein